MASWNGNIFAVSGTLWGEFTGHRWISLTKISDAQIVSLICDWANDWVNKRGAGDLRRHRACYDVTVMRLACRISIIITIISRCPEHMLARALSQFKEVFPGKGISIIKIRRPWDRFILTIEIPMPVRKCLYIETALCCLSSTSAPMRPIYALN